MRNCYTLMGHFPYFQFDLTIFLRHSYHVRNVIQACERIEADVKMPQCCEAGDGLYFIQTVAMKVQHLNV